MRKIVIKSLAKIKKEILDDLKSHLEKRFNSAVEIKSQIKNLDFAFSPKRRQYLASAILTSFKKFKKDPSKWLIIVDVDLYCPDLNFIFGEADIISGLAIISTSRLKPEYYGLAKDEKLFKERIRKEAVHELGHLYFLDHCQNEKCIMYFSNTLADTDKKGADFCQRCKAKLNIK